MDDLEILEQLGASVNRKVTKLRNAIRNKLTLAFNAHGWDLTAEMYSVLRSLWEQDGMNQQSLAERSNKEKANLAKLLDNLEKRGLVYRSVDQKDKRSKLVYLSKKGQEIKAPVLAIASETLLVPEQEIADEKLEITKDVLDQLIRAFTA